MGEYIKTFRRNGVFLFLCGNVLFGGVPLSVKWAVELGVPGAQVPFFRFAFSCLVAAFFIALRFQKVKFVNYKALILRGVFGGIVVFLWFVAISYSSAAKVTLLSYTHSLWANIFGAVLFKEKEDLRYWILLGIAFLGLWLVLDPSFETTNIGDVLALCSGIFGGAAVLAVREARKTDNALSVFSSFSLFGLLVAALLLLLFDCFFPIDTTTTKTIFSLASPEIFIPLLLMGALAAAGQLFFTQAYAYAPVSLGTMLSLTVPVFTTLFSWVFLGEQPTMKFAVGGTLVILASAALAAISHSSEKFDLTPRNHQE